MKWVTQCLQTDRGIFEIFITGSGKPVCVTHNYSEFNSTGDAFAETFAESHQVILINLKETGASAKADEAHQLSMIEAVLDLESIREHMHFESWSFAGHSTGGMIGILYGIYFSQSLDSLIVAGSAAREYTSTSDDCIYNTGHPDNAKMNDLMMRLKSPVLPETERRKLTKERTQLSLYRPEKYEEYFSSEINKKISVQRLNFFNRELSIFDVTRKLHQITIPTLILCGRHDVQCPVYFSIEMNQLIQGSRLTIFEKSNHYPFLEEATKFKEIINEFSDKVEAK